MYIYKVKYCLSSYTVCDEGKHYSPKLLIPSKFKDVSTYKIHA